MSELSINLLLLGAKKQQTDKNIIFFQFAYCKAQNITLEFAPLNVVPT